ncbi:MAG: ABC transporter ATP-binding protein [Proteobacteria bacterium]|nr:ABC transporter ATP-binding protein [Pseudomonadota bacterium]
MLQVQSLSVSRGSIQALHEVSLSVDEGEIVSLVGSNGAGKSTLLYTIAGSLSGAGHILFEGQELNGTSAEQVARLGIALVPEGRQVFGDLSVLDNLLLGTYVHHARHWRYLLGDVRRIPHKPEISRQLASVYKLFPVLEERQKQEGGSLSGGEQQMLAIGRALMAEPRLLLVDELSMGLAPALVTQLLGLLGQMRGMGLTILLVEQDARAALKMADRGYVLETGRIVAEGTADELLRSDRIQKAYLGGAPVITGTVPITSAEKLPGV